MFDFHSEEKPKCFFCIGCSKFLYQIIALFGWSLFLIWLHLTIVTSWFSSLKFLCLKKKRCFCGGFVLFANFHEHSIRYTTHSSHARCTTKKNTHKLISIVIQNHKYLLKTKENFIRWFFRGFYFTIYRGLCVCLCVCVFALFILYAIHCFCWIDARLNCEYCSNSVLFM